MATEEPIKPISEQPEYKTAMANLAAIHNAIASKVAEQQQIKRAIVEIETKGYDSHEVLQRALGLAGCAPAPAESCSPGDLRGAVDRLKLEITTLQDGLREAQKTADRIAESLARGAGRQAAPRHIQAVQRVLEALEALCAANEAEEKVRVDLERAGYHSHGLPFMAMGSIGKLDDHFGSPAFYYQKEGGFYISRMQRALKGGE